jgi:hypothetical protein
MSGAFSKWKSLTLGFCKVPAMISYETDAARPRQLIVFDLFVHLAKKFFLS